MIDDKLTYENDLATAVIGAAIEVHKVLGPGLLESAYESALMYELTLREYGFSSQVHLPLVYKGQDIGPVYRLDILVERRLIVELKSVEVLHPVHYAQTLNYLRISKLKLALLINFNTRYLKDGVHRLINTW